MTLESRLFRLGEKNKDEGTFLYTTKLRIVSVFLVWFHTNFRIVCSISLKNSVGILIGIVLMMLLF